MFQPLFPSFNVATLHMAHRTNPRGWDVSNRAPASLGPRMFQIYAKVNGRNYIGRGFGEGCSVNLKLMKG